MGFIYVITNCINNKQYIGQTRYTVEKRYAEHLSASKQKSPKQTIHKAIKKYLPDNFTITTLEECDNAILNDRERFWINKLNTYHYGYNETLGGQDSFAIGTPVVLINAISLKIIAKYDSIKDAIQAFGSHISECCNHKVKYLKNGIVAYTEEEYKKYTIKELQNDIDNRINIICQLDYYGKLIKQWLSTREIAKYYNCNWGQISSCCLGNNKSAYGYIWCYRKDLYKHLNKIHPHNHCKPIVQFSKNKQQIKIWLSAAEVEKELKIPNGQLSRCCKKNSTRNFSTDKLATCYQYIWIYAPSDILYCD